MVGKRKGRQLTNGELRILSIDIGGTGLKALLVDSAGHLLARDSASKPPAPALRP